METAFILIAALTLGSAIAAMSLRNLVHCALCTVLTFAGLAAMYLQLNAQFVGFAQILVYVGAVAILILFAVLLTRNSETQPNTRITSPSWIIGILVALSVSGTLIYAVLKSTKIAQTLPPAPDATVKKIGEQLMTNYVLPLEVIALLLTAALIGAVIIAMRDSKGPVAADVNRLTSNRTEEKKMSRFTSAATGKAR
ncbi:MAG: NADH-quinone oxidoreductase subunit J [Verrucomicrobiota bacterium]